MISAAIAHNVRTKKEENDEMVAMTRRIVIAGGGSAGWIAASLFQHHFTGTDTEITLVESDKVPVIGVGEGSTPHLRQLFSTLGIAEDDWMPHCHATYKNGIRFEGWQSDHAPGYFHPFPSAPDRHTAGAFLQACERRRQRINLACLPDDYFLANWLTTHHKAPLQRTGSLTIPLNYAYHFDASRLATLLANHTTKQGLKHIRGTVNTVTRHQSGDIDALLLDDGQRIPGDFFVDCTGFRSLLLQQTLEVGFLSYADALFNDAAVACASVRHENPVPATRSVAMENGWRWEIPLTHRTGNGYVYSSQFENKNNAAARLSEVLGNQGNADDIRHIPMKVGRTASSWAKNCLVVGLSQGFIEPLEATALHLVQETTEQFLSAWEAGSYTPLHRDEFNSRIAGRFDGIRDYIVAHYVLSKRSGKYWDAVRAEAKRSDTLTALLQCWNDGGNLVQFIQDNQIGHYYSAVSWYCLLSGYDAYPAISAALDKDASLTAITPLLEKWGATFVSHSEALQRMGTAGPVAC